MRQYIGQLRLVIQKRDHPGTDQHSPCRKRMRFGNGIDGYFKGVELFRIFRNELLAEAVYILLNTWIVIECATNNDHFPLVFRPQDLSCMGGVQNVGFRRMLSLQVHVSIVYVVSKLAIAGVKV